MSKKTDYVVVGEKAGSKEKKARDLGLTILDEAGFVQLLATGTVEATDDTDDADSNEAAEATEVANAADE